MSKLGPHCRSAEAGVITRSFIQLSVGGVLIGVAFGGITVAVLGRIQHDSVIELALVFAGAYLLYYVADFKAEVPQLRIFWAIWIISRRVPTSFRRHPTGAV